MRSCGHLRRLACGLPLSSPRTSTTGGDETNVGDRVRFSLTSVFLPPPDETLLWFSTAGELEGTIAGFSDSGTIPQAFAVVDVVSRRMLVVPVEKLKLQEQEGSKGKDLE